MATLTRSSARTSDEVSLGTHGDFIVLVGRVMLGLIFVLSGWPKLMHFQSAVASIVQRGVPDYIAYLGPPVEFFGGLALLLGCATRYAAILMFVFTLVATLTSHRYWEFVDPALYRAQSTNFWKNVSILGGMLLLFATGGAKYSVDKMILRALGRQHTPETTNCIKARAGTTEVRGPTLR